MDVALAIGETGGSSWLEVKVGEIRRTQRGTVGVLWARCPLEAAIKVAEAGRLMVGWFSARVELLRRRYRLLQCFRCLAVGHVRNRCPRSIEEQLVTIVVAKVTWRGNVGLGPDARFAKNGDWMLVIVRGREGCRPVVPVRSPQSRAESAVRRPAGPGVGNGA